MSALYTIDELVEATHGQLKNGHGGVVTSVSIDSREIEAGALYVAIKGSVHDGHKFVRNAINAGAAYALVDVAHAEEFEDLPIIVVDDVLVGLNLIAAYARARSFAKIIAITGSVGKTSTKEAVRETLEHFGKTHASIRSFNNHWGVPLMLARMPRETEFGIFEIGMNSAGEIRPLSKLVRPHIAVVTNVAAAHLEYFNTIDDIADAKAEIFDGLEYGGLALINNDHDYTERLIASAMEFEHKIETYGFNSVSDVVISNYHVEDGYGCAHVAGPNRHLDISVPSLGEHSISNAVAVLCIVHELDLSVDDAAVFMRAHEAPEGRGATSILNDGKRQIKLIDESYNANPLSMRAALNVLRQTTSVGRKIAVLGDMLELGAGSDAMHKDLAPVILSSDIDLVFLVGDKISPLGEVLPKNLIADHKQSVDEIIPAVLGALSDGDTVMVKASNSKKLGVLVTAIQREFSAKSQHE